jgi:hypothetical protein
MTKLLTVAEVADTLAISRSLPCNGLLDILFGLFPRPKPNPGDLAAL